MKFVSQRAAVSLQRMVTTCRILGSSNILAAVVSRVPTTGGPWTADDTVPGGVTRRHVHTSLSEAPYFPSEFHDGDLDAGHFGYRMVVPKCGRRYTSTLSRDAFEEDYDEYTMFMSSPTPVTSSNLGSVAAVGPFVTGLCTLTAGTDAVVDIIASQREWDEILENDLTRPHFECLKEDPYLSDYESGDQVLHELHTHDVLQEVGIHHKDVDMLD
jgi:hypothetical protein